MPEGGESGHTRYRSLVTWWTTPVIHPCYVQGFVSDRPLVFQVIAAGQFLEIPTAIRSEASPAERKELLGLASEVVVVDVAQGRLICVRLEGAPRIPTRWSEFGRFQELCYNGILLQLGIVEELAGLVADSFPPRVRNRSS